MFERPFNAEASAKHWSGFVNSLSLYFLYFVRIVAPRIALLAAGNILEIYLFINKVFFCVCGLVYVFLLH